MVQYSRHKEKIHSALSLTISPSVHGNVNITMTMMNTSPTQQLS